MLPSLVVQWLHDQGYGAVVSKRAVSGGCINNGARLFTSSGETFFLKFNASLPPDVFQREFEGLQVLRKQDGPYLPQPLLAGTDFLLQEDLNPTPLKPDFWNVLGRQLASLHNHTHSQFGFYHDNYLGSTPQPNPWTEAGTTFFVQQRLMFQANLAHRNGLVKTQELRLVERLCNRLPELIPPQPASLIHGDLWSGNVISNSQGEPAIIDPAAHYGWAEAELGMTSLFGGFPPIFYQAYTETRPLETGWRERLPIYNLYHLFNHLNLFGMGYYEDVLALLKRYA